MEKEEKKTTAENTADTPLPRSRAFMASKYPDETWDDDEAYENALATHLEESDKSLSEYRNTDDKIAEILERDPDFAMVLQDMGNGVPFRVALRRRLGDLDMTPEEEDSDYEDWKKAGDEYLENKRKVEEEIKVRNGNIEVSEKKFADFLDSQTDWDDAKKDGFVAFFNDICQELARGEVSDKVIAMLSDAYTHDDDVAAALEEGEVNGRNEKIEAQRIKRDNVDGVPAGGGSNPSPKSRPRKKEVINISKALGVSDEELENLRKKTTN